MQSKKTGPQSEDALKYYLRFRATHREETTLTRDERHLTKNVEDPEV
jgi:hypothetical protein